MPQYGSHFLTGIFFKKTNKLYFDLYLLKCISLQQTENSGNTLFDGEMAPTHYINFIDMYLLSGFNAAIYMLSNFIWYRWPHRNLTITLEKVSNSKKISIVISILISHQQAWNVQIKSRWYCWLYTQQLTHQSSTWFVVTYLSQKSSNFGPWYAIA